MTHEIRPGPGRPPAAPGQPHDQWEELPDATEVEELSLGELLRREAAARPQCAVEVATLLAQTPDRELGGQVLGAEPDALPGGGDPGPDPWSPQAALPPLPPHSGADGGGER